MVSGAGSACVVRGSSSGDGDRRESVDGQRSFYSPVEYGTSGALSAWTVDLSTVGRSMANRALLVLNR